MTAKEGRAPVANPLASANILSRIFFFWPSALMRKKGELTEADLYDLIDDDTAGRVHSSLSEAWQKELTQAKPSLSKAYFRAFALAYVAIWPSMFVKQGLVIAQTQFLGLLLNGLNTGTADTSAVYGYGVGLVLCAAIAALLHHVYYFSAWLYGMRWRAASTALISEKALKLRLQSLSKVSAGFVVNLVAGDVERLQKAAQYFIYLILAPIESAVCCWLLYREVGIAFLGGLAVLIAMMLAMAWFSQAFGKLRHQTSVITDERVRVTGQVVGGIRTVKSNAWEGPFAKRVAEIRGRESAKISMTSWLRGFNEGIFVVASILIACATFLVYTAGMGNVLTASKLWTTMSLFAILQLEAGKFWPLALEARAEVAIAMQRIQSFLQLEEAAPLALPTAATTTATTTTQQTENPLQKGASASVASSAPDTGIFLREVTASWTTSSGTSSTSSSINNSSPPALSNVTFTASCGKLTMVAGPVSCGKSSLLQAILGELPVSSGEIRIGNGTATTSPRIAYVSQTPWILTASFRENVTFGLPFDQAKYDRVIDVCCLKDDVAMLPQGDLTLQGEKGVSLSGGQRSRLALARACYLEADIYLIDDTLAAVDARVGRRIFRKCLSDEGLLAGKTRIVALHQLQYLKNADSIAVLASGRVITQGTFQDLSRALAEEKRAQKEGEGKAAAGGGETLGAALSEILLAAGDHHHGHGHGSGNRRSRGSSAVSNDADGIESLSAELACEEDEVEDEGEKTDTVAPLAERQTMPALTIPAPSSSAALGGMTALATPSVYGSSASSYTAGAAATTTATAEAANDASPAPAASAAVVPTVNDAASPSSSPSSPVPAAAAKAAAPPPAPSVVTSLIQAEKVSTGSVSSTTYRRYFEAAGGWVSVIYLAFLTFGGAALFLYASVWLSVWSNASPSAQVSGLYPNVFGILVAVSLVVSIWRAAAFFLACVAASRKLHDAAFAHVLKAPLSFFDSNPSGRIINRLSKDIGILDDLLPATLFDFLSAFATVLAIVVLVVVINPWVLISLPPLLIALHLLQSYYILSSRQIKRIEGVSRSPIFSLLNESLNGLVVVRAFKLQPLLFQRMLAAIDGNSRAYFFFLGISRWLGVRLDLLCVLLYTVVCFACIPLSLNGSISASLVGLLLSQTATLVSGVQWTVRQWIETQNQLTSAERVLEYAELPTEDLDVTTDEPLPSSSSAGAVAVQMTPQWPSKGAITLNDVWLCYRPELPPVLRGLSATIPSGAFVGIVGKTGVGKSSLMGALLRLVEPERHPLRKDLLDRVENEGPTTGVKNADGTCGICIDGRDIATVPLTQLRRGISVIPQEPWLSSGSARFNLDPFNQFTDEQVVTALQRSQLWGRQITSLDMEIKEGGANLSVGARQLVCLARAILRHSSLLLLDECSANIDEDSDAAIQSTLKTAFKGSTVLVVAHRLNTVASADIILHMAEGKAAELEHPHVLLSRKEGHFYSLAKELGEDGFKVVADEAKRAWEAKQ